MCLCFAYEYYFSGNRDHFQYSLFTISKRAAGLKMLGFGFNLKSSAFKNITDNHKDWKYILKDKQKNTVT